MRMRAGGGTTCGRRLVQLVLGALVAASGTAIAAEVDEVEPNAGPGTATTLPDDSIGVGDISPIGDRDFWKVTGATAGDLIFALVETAQSTSGNTDAVLVSYDNNASPIQDDDNDGPGFAPALGGDVVPVSGDVSYEIFDLNDDGTITPYRLFQLIADPAASVPESEPNGTAAEANDAAGNSTATGTLPDNSDVDFYAVPLLAGDELVAVLDRDPDDTGFSVGSLIDILDTDGTTVLAAGDITSGDVHGVGPVQAPEDTTYFVRVGRSSGTDDDYRIAFLTVAPEASVLASALASLAALGALRRKRPGR
jgi:hypothetical protein